MFNTNVLNNLKLEAIQVFGSTTQQVYINRKQVKVVHALKPATGKNDRLVKLRMMMTTKTRWVFKLMLKYSFHWLSSAVERNRDSITLKIILR